MNNEKIELMNKEIDIHVKMTKKLIEQRNAMIDVMEVQKYGKLFLDLYHERKTIIPDTFLDCTINEWGYRFWEYKKDGYRYRCSLGITRWERDETFMVHVFTGKKHYEYYSSSFPKKHSKNIQEMIDEIDRVTIFRDLPRRNSKCESINY